MGLLKKYFIRRRGGPFPSCGGVAGAMESPLDLLAQVANPAFCNACVTQHLRVLQNVTPLAQLAQVADPAFCNACVTQHVRVL